MFNVRPIARLVGQIISMKAVFRNVVRIMTKHLYLCVESQTSWNGKIFLSESAIQEVLFWSENIYNLNVKGAMLRTIDVSDLRDFKLFSDASDTGYGGYIIPDVQRSDTSSSQQGEDMALFRAASMCVVLGIWRSVA